MSSCLPASNNNNVSDVNANKKPPSSSSESRLSRLITCLFFRKKTDVVDMGKESSASLKKQRMSVDRSERSKRVLKMESMRTAPMKRDENDVTEQSPQGASQMFLPSENPKASFLSYLNPSVRRACSEVIRTSRPNVREAFTENGRLPVTRNTNYRGQSSDGKKSGKPPKLPERHSSSVSPAKRGVIVVPGVMASDDDVGYDSDEEIRDFQDEMRRMNLSHPDLRETSKNADVRQKRRRREGSISLSEDDSASDAEVQAEPNRPQNPSPGQLNDVTHDVTTNASSSVVQQKTRSMEDVIDDLFMQTRSNIDSIYRDGLENMGLETYRSETMTPETCMRRLEDELLKECTTDQAEAHLGSERKKPSLPTRPPPPTPANIHRPHMDKLLDEVSIWAQDRQKWILENGGKIDTLEPSTRESTMDCLTPNGNAIEMVKQINEDEEKHSEKTNNGRLSSWLNDQSVVNKKDDTESLQVAGILTGPRLFRSTTRNPQARHVSFGGNETEKASFTGPPKSESTRVVVPRKRTYKGVQVIDYGNDDTEVVTDPVINDHNQTEQRTSIEIKDINEQRKNIEIIEMKNVTDGNVIYPEPWTSDMYKRSPNIESDRSTIHDNLSELDEKATSFRPRSPDSWLSSNGSCSNLLNKPEHLLNDVNDCFEVPNRTQNTDDVHDGKSKTPEPVESASKNLVKATNINKSHQIERKAPKVHSFKELERQISLTKQPILPVLPMLRNTQIEPLSVLPTVKPTHSFESFPALPGMKTPSFKTSRNMKEQELLVSHSTMRPFSEIPLRPDFGQGRNSRLLANRNDGPNGQDSSHPMDQFIIRPVSETFNSSRRVDKIGMGPIMATKEKQTYAQNIVNAIEKQRMKPKDNAFTLQIPVANESNEVIIEETNSKPEKKRHKVFTQGLIGGGYNYDKHSRKNKPIESSQKSKSFSEMHGASEPVSLNHNASLNVTSSTPTASINDLSLSIRGESFENHPMEGQNQLQFHTKGGVVNDANQKANGSLNRSQSLQTHNISGNIRQDDVLRNGNTNATADKFRKLRTRRDVEMDWLLKDAAETEV
ncbi:hypothetical protein DPMN_123908 [Dreissena polymorpha]|uniref:Uncharacterized protein n=1 Tax=Dreissena polymorpha TaxID=45954 RepID=A0A9D4JVN3_DREPO|nr:hypothetical protein DPMN_123908 [Dreissena polymorpha]